MSDIVLVHVEDAFACGARDELAVLVWRGVPTAERVERSFQMVARACDAAGGRIGVIALIESGSPPPPVTLFPDIARGFDALAGLIATAGVLEDRGALATRVLDAMSAVTQLARRKHPVKVCADAAEAATWMARRLGAASIERFRLDALELIEHVRASLPA